MCGRYSLFAPQNDVEERFGATFVEGYQPRYNAAPSQELPILPDAAPETFRTAEWGLVPTWADERDDGGHINARAETVAEKPTFAASFEGGAAGDESITEEEASGAVTPGGDTAWKTRSAGRCLVPADGFYEWGDAGDGRRPYRIEVGERAPFAMAGLWTRWTPRHRQTGLGEFAGERGEAEPIHTFSILTTEANDVLAPIHDRMPVILTPDEENTWLAGDPERVQPLLDPYEGSMRRFAVSEDVNSPRNDRPSVVEPVDG